jgi:bacterioferritin (cytochrome b1)
VKELLANLVAAEGAQAQFRVFETVAVRNLVDREKLIAQKWLDAFGQYERSWVSEPHPTLANLGKYMSDRTVDKIFADSLAEEEKQSGFAMILYAWSSCNTNSAQEICQMVLAEKTFIMSTEELRRAEEESNRKLVASGAVVAVDYEGNDAIGTHD